MCTLLSQTKSLITLTESLKLHIVGMTKSGSDRIAASASAKAKELLSLHGVKSLKFYVVTCSGRQKVKSWAKLERALLLVFRERFDIIPKCNHQGKGIRWTDELDYFTKPRLSTVIAEYSDRAT